jgi:hypothetical protein
MRFRPFRCPTCKRRANRILENILGDACLIYDPDQRAFQYEGETKVDWDSQETVVAADGTVTLSCGNHTWQAKRLAEKQEAA